MILENQVNEAAFRQTVLTNGWATEDQVYAVVESAPSFAQRNDVSGFIVFPGRASASARPDRRADGPSTAAE